MPSDINIIMNTLQVPEATVAAEGSIKTWASWVLDWDNHQMAYKRTEQLSDTERYVLGELWLERHASEDQLLEAAHILLHYRRILEIYAEAEALSL